MNLIKVCVTCMKSSDGNSCGFVFIQLCHHLPACCFDHLCYLTIYAPKQLCVRFKVNVLGLGSRVKFSVTVRLRDMAKISASCSIYSHYKSVPDTQVS